jgi:hypothetical protein
MPKAKLSEATVTVTKILQQIISDPVQVEQGLNGLLQYEGRTILVCKGGDVTKIVNQVYSKFLNSKDATGEPFRFSIKARGLVHVDKIWHATKRVSGPEFLNYLSDWFIPCQLLSNVNGPALVILTEVPPLFGALCQQTRFSGAHAEIFPLID